MRTIDEFLQDYPPNVRRLVGSARGRIRAIVPHAVEKLRSGWGLIGYNAPAYFAFIVPAENHIRIGFEWGVMLPDPRQVLEGKGSQVRYLTIRTLKELTRPDLAEFLRRAAAILPPKIAKNGLRQGRYQA